MTSAPPTPDAFRCPTCGSENTTRSQLAYRSGVTHVSGIVDGLRDVGVVSLRTESDASRQHAPPPLRHAGEMYVRDPEGILGMMGMVLSFIAIMAGLDVGAWLSGAGVGGLAISALVYYLGWRNSDRSWREHAARDAAEHARWQQRMTCLRCGADWQP